MIKHGRKKLQLSGKLKVLLKETQEGHGCTRSHGAGASCDTM